MTDASIALSTFQQAYQANPYPTLKQRQQQLEALRHRLLALQDALCEAAAADFGQRDASETRLLELFPTLNSLNYSKKQLRSWLKPAKRHVSWLFQPAKNYVMYQPLGVVGIIVPWNYPIFLSLGPLIAAISAGNKVLLKLSEYTPHTNAVLKQLIESALPDAAMVIEGDAQVAAAFSQLPFDHLLYTGSTVIGRQVMQAASQHLTPVTLELGGKSPVLIGPDASIPACAARIIFGKTANAGQTCVAPDYVLVPRAKLPELIQQLQRQYQQFYPQQTADSVPVTSLIHARQQQRLLGYLQQARDRGADVLSCAPSSAAGVDVDARLLPLHLVINAPLDAQLWQQEIFGPILPLQPYDSLAEAVQFIQQRPRPLALYLFSHDKQLQQQVLQQIHAGGVCINETLLHVGQDDLPFGGIGPSGMGNYHGKEGFLTFSHAKAVHQKGRINSMIPAYPQYRKKLLDPLIKWLLKP